MPFPVAACRGKGSHVEPVVTLLSDAFTGADGTNLSGRALDVGGVNWTVGSGAWDINGNRARRHTANAEAHIWADAGRSNVTVSATLNRGGSASGIGILLRMQDDTNGWLADLGGGELAIYEINAAVFTKRASSSYSNDNGTDHVLVAAANGTGISANANGGHAINYTSTFQQATTKHGMKAFAIGAKLDAFLVRSL